MQKAVNLKHNMKTLKTELIQRENIADSLKRQNRELRHTINIQASGKDLSMYTPTSPVVSNLEGPHTDARKSKTSAKYSAAGYSEGRRSVTGKSKTPQRE
jgi:hypothetical protein